MEDIKGYITGETKIFNVKEGIITWMMIYYFTLMLDIFKLLMIRRILCFYT
jgi:hypothetical protein